MDIDILAQFEQQFDDLFTRVKALEAALTQLPEVTMQPDPSRPPGVVVVESGSVEPAELNPGAGS